MSKGLDNPVVSMSLSQETLTPSLSLKKGEGVLIDHFPLSFRGEDSPGVIKE